MFSSLEAGNENITKDLLEALDKAAKLCTRLAPGEVTIFAEARSQLCQLLGRKAVSHANVAKYFAMPLPSTHGRSFAQAQFFLSLAWLQATYSVLMLRKNSTKLWTMLGLVSTCSST